MGYIIRRSNERGFQDHGWLKAYHTFSFGSYHDPKFMNFRSLRVINEDRFQPRTGFPTHPHSNMEILTRVLQGELFHEDSMGNSSIIRANEAQLMTAGTGVSHSEFNSSDQSMVHLLQIWIIPDTKGLAPSYQQQMLDFRENEWTLIASKSAREGSFLIHQDIEISEIHLTKEFHLEKSTPPSRYGWLQVISGQLAINQDSVNTGDGVAIDPDTALRIKALTPAKVLYFDMA